MFQGRPHLERIRSRLIQVSGDDTMVDLNGREPIDLGDR